MEKQYAFIKDSIVVNVAVFAEENQELADTIVTEQGYDLAVWCGTDAITMGSTWDGKNFIAPEPIIVEVIDEASAE